MNTLVLPCGAARACRALCALFAACVLLAGGASFAQEPAHSPPADPLAALQAAYARAVVPGQQAALYGELWGPVLQRVQRHHAMPVELGALSAAALPLLQALPAGSGDPAEVFRKALREALRTLDPHTRYLDARALDQERSIASGSFGGLGIEVRASDGAVRIVAPLPGSPAERAGLLAGDLIVRVDQQSLHGLPLDEVIARLRGQPGTPVLLTVQRAGSSEERTVALTRDTIRRQLLRASQEGDLLVLRLTAFGAGATAALEQAVAAATAAQPPAGVVLDLRGNPGGLLREAVRVADAFLGRGDIVSVRGNAAARTQLWQADAAELLPGVPMVVLIDGRSASASELVADALQAHGRAVVVGQRSFGKGSVQTTFALGEQRGAIKVTTAIYHGPTGRTLHRVGVVPDIELAVDPGRDRPEAAPQAADATALGAPRTRLDPARCAAASRADPALSCAIAYLGAGSVDAFVAGLAPTVPAAAP